MPRFWTVVLSAATVLGLAHRPLTAQENAPRVRVSGFGGSWYGKTDVNRYLGGTPAGEYNNSDLSVLVSSDVSDRLSISALVHWSLRGNQQNSRFDYAFASWRISRSFDIRVGKVKHPGALYSEVFGVGTIRPFLALPQSVYSETACLTFDDYTGLGVNGHVFAGDWDIGIIAYGGGGGCDYFPARLALILAGIPNGQFFNKSVSARDNLGGRITVRPPITGLQLGVSAVRVTPGPEGTPSFTVYQAGAQAEYTTDELWLRSEVYHNWGNQEGQGGFGRVRITGFYAEAAYLLHSRWQLAGQYGYLQDKYPDSPPVPSSLDRHRDWAIGLNHWLNTNFVLKGGYHRVSGNRLAHPDGQELLQAVTSGQLKPRTGLLELGAQFSF